MKLKALYSIIKIIAAAFIFASCSVNTNNLPVDKVSDKAETSMAVMPTQKYYNSGGNKDIEVKKSQPPELIKLDFSSKYEFYKNNPEASFLLEETYPDNLFCVYYVQYSGEAYSIKYAENNMMIKTVGLDPRNQIYHLINNKTNTSLNISNKDMNNNLSDIINPYDLLIPGHYGISEKAQYKFAGNETIEGVPCEVYQILYENVASAQKIYVSGKNKIIVKFEDTAKGITAIVKNFYNKADLNEIIIDITGVPVVDENQHIPIEGQGSDEPEGYFDTTN